MSTVYGTRPIDRCQPISHGPRKCRLRKLNFGQISDISPRPGNVVVGQENQIERLLVVLGCLNFQLMCDGLWTVSLGLICVGYIGTLTFVPLDLKKWEIFCPILFQNSNFGFPIPSKIFLKIVK